MPIHPLLKRGPNICLKYFPYIYGFDFQYKWKFFGLFDWILPLRKAGIFFTFQKYFQVMLDTYIHHIEIQIYLERSVQSDFFMSSSSSTTPKIERESEVVRYQKVRKQQCIAY